MECEWDNCFEPAVAFKPVLGVMRHLCALHAGGRGEATTTTTMPTPLEDAIELVKRLEYYEHNQNFDGYEVTLAEYEQLAASQPITLARAIKHVLDSTSAPAVGTGDLPKPF